MHISIAQPFFVVGPLAIALRATPKREYQQQKNNTVNNINKLHYYLSCVPRGQWPTGLCSGLQLGGRRFDSGLDYYIILFYNYPNE